MPYESNYIFTAMGIYAYIIHIQTKSNDIRGYVHIVNRKIQTGKHTIKGTFTKSN